MENFHAKFMKRAIALADEGMKAEKGGPFGAVVVKNGEIIAEACNSVLSTKDPTAHAEMLAIRQACAVLGHFQLDDCVIYTSCEPCPMCLGAVYWARPKAIFYACSKEDAAAIQFDDSFIYTEIAKAPVLRKIPMQQVCRDEALPLFEEWGEKGDKRLY